MRDRPAVRWSEAQIHDRVRAIGAEIGTAFEGRELAVVGLMKSCLVFMADLIRTIPLDMTCHLLRASSLRKGGEEARIDITYESPIPYKDRDVLIVDDIVDTGITLNYLLEHIREHRPRTLKVCALINKPGDRKIDVRLDWAAFTLEDSRDFLVGYGLDHEESFRGLPYIGIIPRPASPAGVRTNTLSPGQTRGEGPQEA
jgi:hypoxanthine phosphoribosyltransferase